MSGSAHVESVDAIKDFRVYLTKFQDLAGRALGDADSDVNRMTRWLEGEGLNLWTSTIRKRQEVLAKAEEALRFKKLYKDSSGSTPSVVEEQKAVKKAKDALNDAQEKLKNVKKWTSGLQKASTIYRGGVSSFSGDVSSGVPQMIGYLGALLDQLDKYLEVATVGPAGGAEGAAAGSGAMAEDAGASMARAAEEAEKKEPGAEIDPGALRDSIPSADAISTAVAGESGPVMMGCGRVTEEQRKAVGDFATGDAPADGERVVVSPGLGGAGRVFLVRLEYAGTRWYLGPVEGGGSGVYNTVSAADLESGRPDLAELLRLPVGFLAVIGPGGVEAVFDSRNENVLKQK